MLIHYCSVRARVLARFALLATTLVAAVLLSSGSAQAASGTWTNTATGGLWDTTTNWSGGTVANLDTFTADFSTIDITADNTVHLNSAHTIGNLTFGDTATGTAAGWILDNNGTATNILTLGATSHTITVNALGTGKNVTISARLGGTNGLIKAGAGTLRLTNATVSQWTGTTDITNGVLEIAGGGGDEYTSATWNISSGATLRQGANNQITNAAAITVSSGGVFDLNGFVDTTGVLTLSGSGIGGTGALLNNTGTSATTFSSITLAGSTSIGGSGNITLGAAISDGASTFALTKVGTGTLTLNNAANTYDGVTTINGGILNANTIANGGSSSSIGPSGSAATNLVLDGGTLQHNAANVASTNRLFTLGLGATAGALDSSAAAAGNTLSFTDNVGSIAFSGSGARTLTLTGTNTGSNTLAPILGDSGGATALNKSAAGTWIVSGANTYTGGTNLNGGTLQANSLQSLGTTGNVVFGGGALQYTATSAGGGAQDYSSRIKNSASAIAIDTNGNAVTFGGIIDATNTAGLTKSGTGTLSLTGANLYTGTTTIAASGGTLQISGSGSLGAAASYASAITLTGGTLQYSSSANQTFTGAITSGGALIKDTNTSTLTLNNTGTNYSGTTTVSAGTLKLINATGFASATTIGAGATLELNSTNATVDNWTSASATFSGTSTAIINKTGTGWIDFTNANALTGFNGQLNIQAGTFGSGFLTGGIGSAASTMAVDVSGPGGALFDVRGTPTLVRIDKLTGAGTVGTTWNVASGITIGTGGGSSQFDGVIAGNASSAVNLPANPNAAALSLTKVGSGTFTLAGTSANIYTGATTVSGGTLALAKTASTNSIGSATITIGDGATTPGNDILQLNTSNQIIDTAVLTLNGTTTNAGIFRLNAQSDTVGGLSSAAGAGIVENNTSGTSTLTLSVAGTQTFSGILQDGAGGTLALSKSGVGTQILSGANTYTGTTTVTAGVLQLNSATALPGGIGAAGGTSALTLNGGVVGLGNGDFLRDLGTGSAQVQFTAGGGGFAAYTADRAVNLGGASATVTWNSGSFVPTGSALILGASAATNTVDFQNPINLANATRTVQVDNGTAATDARISSVISSTTPASGGLTKTGTGTLALTGANTYTGDTVVSGGLNGGVMLILANSTGPSLQGNLIIGASGDVAGNLYVTTSAVNQFGANSVLNLNHAAGVNSTPVFELLGNNQTVAGITNTGTTFIENTQTETLIGNSILTINNSANFLYSSNIRNTGTGSGNLGITKDGSGTQTLSGAGITYTGATVISGGTLRLTSTTGYNSATSINANGTLALNGADHTNPGTFTLNGGALLTDENGGYVVSSKVLTVTDNSILQTSGTGILNSDSQYYLDLGLNIASGKTLSLNTSLNSGIVLRGDASSSGSLVVTGAGTTSLAGRANLQFNTAGSLNFDNTDVTLTNATMNVGQGLNGDLNATGASVKSLSGNGKVVSDNVARMLTVGTNDGTGGNFSGVLANGTSILSVTKAGLGTQTLSGANTYTGTTLVSAGTLALSHASNNNIANSATINVAGGAFLDVTGLNSGAGLTVGAGGAQTLKGTGTVTGNFTIGPSGILAPGTSPGTLLHAGNETWSGGTYQWEVNQVTAGGGTQAALQGLNPGFDWESISGSLSISSPFTLDITGLNGAVAGGATNWDPHNSYTWVIATASSISGSANSLITVNPANFTSNNSIGSPGGLGTFVLSQTSTDVILTFNAATAVSHYWDINGATAGAGGATPSGNWGAASNWSYGVAGDVATHAWVSGDDAIFSAGADATGAYTATIDAGGVTAHNITVMDGTTVTIGGGTLTLNGATPTLDVASGKTLLVNSVIDGVAGLTKTNAGTLTLTGPNTYTGPTAIQNGILSIGSIKDVGGGASNLGAPTTVADGTIALGSVGNNGNLTYTGGAQDTNRVIDLAGTTGGGTITQSGASGLLKFTSGLTATGAGAKTLTLQGSAGGTGEIAGAIVNSGGGATAVAKLGTGTWTLSGANSYSGLTTIGGGTLVLSGASSTTSGITLNAGTNTTLLVTDAGATGSGVINTSTGVTTPFLQFHIDGGGTIALPNALGGNSGIVTTIDVNNNGSGTNGVIQLNGNPSFLGTSTYNITGGNGYSLFINKISESGGGAGTLTLNPTTANVSIGSMTGGAAQAYVFALGGTSTGNSVTGAITTGTATSIAVTKSGTGTWTLSGANVYAGATTISGGTLTLASGGSITSPAALMSLNTSSAATLNIASGASISVLNLQASTGTGLTPTVNIAGNWTSNQVQASARQFIVGTWTQTGGTVSARGIEISPSVQDTASYYLGGGTLTANQGQFSSLIVGGRNVSTFAVSGSATLTVNGTANPANNVEAQLFIGASNSYGTNLAGNRTFVQQGGTVTANGITLGNSATAVPGTGVNGVYYLNGGTLTTNTLNRGTVASNTGTFIFGGGTFKNGTAFSTDVNVATSINSGGATIDTTGGNLTWSGAITAGTTQNVNGFTSLVGGSGYTPGQMTLSFTGGGGSGATGYAVVDQSGTVTDIVVTNPGSGYTSAPAISGFVGGTGASATATVSSAAGGGLTKAGNNILSLSGANTYTGATAINAGTLRVNGSTVAASAVTINSGGTLGGIGNVGGTVNLLSGGTLAPGQSVGTLTTGAETWNSGGAYTWEVNSVTAGGGAQTAGVGADLLSISGSLTLPTGPTFNIDITGLNGAVAGSVANWNPHTSYQWTIASATSVIGAFNAGDYSLNTGAFTNNNTLGGNGSFAISQSGNNIVLNYTGSTTAMSAYWDLNNTTGGAGTTPTGNWSTSAAANWNFVSGGTGTTANWTNGDDAVFSAGADAVNPFTVTIVGGVSAHNITFEEGTPTITASTLTLTGTTPTITLNNTTNSAIINSQISGSAGLTVNTDAATRVLTLGGANNYTGVTTINRGTVSLTNASGLGASGAGNETTINGNDGSAATILSLTAAGAGLTIAEDFNLNSSALGRATITNTSAQNHTFTGAITLTSTGSLINLESSSTGSITVSGDITGTASGAGTFLFLRGNSTNANNRLLGSVNLTGGDVAKTDVGTWVIGGASETYSWVNTSVAQGTIRMATGINAVLPASGTITLGQGNTSSTATLDLNGTNQTTAGITFNYTSSTADVGTISTGAGTLTLNGNLTFTNAANTYTATTTGISGNLNFGGGTRTFTIADSTASATEFTVSAAITNGALIKAGAGNLALTGAGAATTYAGGTTVNTGTLTLGGTNNSFSTVGAGTITINGSGTVSATADNVFGSNVAAQMPAIIISGGTLTLAAGVAGDDLWIKSLEMTAGTISGGGAGAGVDMRFSPTVTTHASASSATISAKATLSTNTIFSVENGGAADDLLISGLVTGTGTFTKSDVGTLTLTNVGTNYTGATSITGGTLVLRASSSAFASPVTVSSGATLQYSPTAGYAIASAAADVDLQGTLAYNSTGNFFQQLTAGTVTVNATSTISLDAVPGAANNTGLFLDGGLQGSAALTVNANDPGVGLVLRTSASTYSGSMTVNGTASTVVGTGSGLAIGFNGTLGNLPNADITVNGTLELGTGAGLGTSQGWANGTVAQITGTTFQMDALNGTGVIVANMASAGTKILSVGNNNGTGGNFSGVIANGTNSTLSFTKAGSGTQTLSGLNTYTGITTINAGTLSANTIADSVGSSIGLTALAGGVTFSGGRLNFTGVSGATQRSFVFSGAGTFDLNGGSTLTLNSTNAAASATVAGWSGSGGVTKDGTGTLAVGNNNASIASRFTVDNLRGGNFTMSGGTLNIKPSLYFTIGDTASTGTSTFTQTAGTVNFTPATNAASSDVWIGNAASAGQLLITGGSFNVTTSLSQIRVGQATAGTLTVGGGASIATVNTPKLVTAAGAGGGTINIGGGSGLSTLTAPTVVISFAGGTGATNLNLKVNGVLETSSLSKDTGSGVTNLQFDGGTLKASAANASFFTGTYGTSAITANGLTVDSNSFDIGISTVFSGAGGVTKISSGTLTLSGVNTNTGKTTVNAGRVSIAAETGLGSNPGAFTADQLTLNGGTLRNTSVITFAAANRGITLGASGGTFDTAANLTISGTNVITGAGNLTKINSAGTLTLSAVNTYTGKTIINAGTVTIGAETGLGSNPGAFAADQLTLDGGTLQFSGSTTIDDANRGITLGAGNATFDTVGAGSASTISNVITGSGNLTKIGAGQLFLNAVNTYTGKTIVNAGKVAITAEEGLGSNPGAFAADQLTLNGGTLRTTLTPSTINDANRGITLGASGGTFETAADLTIANVVTGSGSLTKEVAGTLTLSGNNSYAGVTNINTGVVNIQHANALGTTAGSTTVAAGAALQIQGTITTASEALSLNGTGIANDGALRNISGDNTYSGAITLATPARINSDSGTLTLDVASGNAISATNQSVTFGGAGKITVADAISLGAATLTKDGAGTLKLSAPNSYTGDTTITAGTLQLGVSNVIPDGPGNGNVSLTGTFDLNTFSETINGLSGTGTIDTVAGGTPNLTVGNNNATSTFGGVIQNTAGTLSLTKTGSGTLQLTNTSTYSGPTTVAGGTLNLNGSIANSNVTVQTGATLSGTGTTKGLSIDAGAFHSPGNSPGITTVMGNYTMNGTLNFEIATPSGSVPGTDYDQVVVTSGGTVSLSGTLNAFYSGTAGTFNPAFAQEYTIIDNDLSDAVSGTFAGLAAGTTVMVDGKPLKIYYDEGTGNDVVLVSNYVTATPIALYVDATFVSPSTVDGDRNTAGQQTAFVGSNAFASPALALAAYPSTNANILVNGGTYASALLAGGGNVTLQLASDTVAAQADVTLQNLSGDATDNIATRFLGASGGNLIAEQGSFAGVISGAGDVTKTTSGTLTLSGNNTYTGATSVTAGVLNIQHGNALGTTAGGTDVANGAALELQGTIAVGTEALGLVGTGVGGNGALRNISGANSWAGVITLNGATEIQSDAGSLTLSGNIVNGANTLTVDGAGQTFITGILGNGSGGLTMNGSGLLGLSGANTYGGATNVNAGTLRLDASNVLPDSTTVTVAGGATLNVLTNSDTITALVVQNNGSVTASLSGTPSLTMTSAGNAITLNDGADLNNPQLTLFLTGVGGSTLLVQGNATGAPSQITSAVDTGAAVRTFNVNDITSSSATDLEWIGTLQGASGWTKTGAGTLEFTSGNTNTYTGTATLNQGLVVLNRTAGTNVITGNLVIGDGSGIDTVRLDQSNQIADTGNVTVNSSGVLNRNGNSDAIAALNLNSSLVTGSGTLTLGGTLTSTGTSTVTGGNLDLGGNRTIAVTGTLTVNDVVQGAGNNLTKTGTGTLVLTNANTYSGTTEVNGGTLELSNTAPGGTLANTTLVTVGTAGGGAATDTLVLNNTAAHTLGTGQLLVGDTETGVVNHNAGNVTVGNGNADHVRIGVGAQGTYNLNNGAASTLNVGPNSAGNRANLIVGESNVGFFNLGANATVNAGDVIVGQNATGTGTITMTGGTLNVHNATTMIVGDAGTGTHTQSAGTVNAGSLVLGNQSTGNGTVNLSGTGSMNVTLNTTVGNAGTGDFNISGTAQHNVSGNLIVAAAAGSTGTYDQNLGGAPSTSITGNVNVGTGGAGTVNLANGTFTSSGNTTIGGGASAAFNQTGGTHTLNGTGTSGNMTLIGGGTYSLSGTGQLDFQDYVGTVGGGPAWVADNYSTLTMDDGADFTFSGGTLLDVSHIVTGGTTFTQGGGRLVVGQDEAGNTLGPWTAPALTEFDNNFTQLAGIIDLDVFGEDLTPEDCCDAGQNDALLVQGTATLGGVTRLSFVDFDPEFGDIFNLVCADNIVLQPGFGIQGGFFRVVPTGNADHPFALQAIVPEPASVAVWTLVGLAGAAGAWRSRKRLTRRRAA